jgi:hypothetical protein
MAVIYFPQDSDFALREGKPLPITLVADPNSAKVVPMRQADKEGDSKTG